MTLRYPIWVIIVNLMLGTLSAKIRYSQGEPMTPCTPTYESHLHLFSKERVPFQASEFDFHSVQHGADAAVIFHGFLKSEKDLLMAKLLDLELPLSQSRQGFNDYDRIHYDHGRHTLHVIDIVGNGHHPASDELKHHISNALSFLEQQSLSLHAIYVVIDTRAIDEEYARGVSDYIVAIRNQYKRYGPLGRDKIKLVFNNVEGLDTAAITERVERIRTVLQSNVVFDWPIATSAHEGIGHLLRDLKETIKSVPVPSNVVVNDLQHRQHLLNAQIGLGTILHETEKKKASLIQSRLDDLRPQLALDSALLNCTSSVLSAMNPVPDIKDLQPWPKSAPNQKDEVLWVIKWMKSGSDRALLANHWFDQDHYKDSKSEYEGFVQRCDRNSKLLLRYDERVQAEATIKAGFLSLNSTQKLSEDDHRRQLDSARQNGDSAMNNLTTLRQYLKSFDQRRSDLCLTGSA